MKCLSAMECGFFRITRIFAVVTVLTPYGSNASQLTVPNTFTSGSAISSSAMNSNFSTVSTAVNDNDSRLTTLETQSAAQHEYYAEQGATDGGTAVDDVWVDIPGVAIPLTFATPTNFKYLVTARVYNYGASVGAVANCSVRIVQDELDTPLNSSSPATIGEWNAVLSGGADQPNNSQQLALSGLKTAFPAGTYNFKLQIVRKAMTGNSGTCDIFRWNFSKARFFIDIVP